MQGKPTVLVAGATGYIGSHIARALHDAGYRVRVLTRSEERLEAVADACDEVFVGEATRMETLDGLCDGIEVVVSSLGLRTLRAQPTAEAVDLQANLNILEHAQKTGVRQFVFVSVLGADELVEMAPIIRPREEFVERLKDSGLRWTVLRPTGAFNDLEGVFRLAKRGWGVVLGDGKQWINPIHAADIAEVALRSVRDPSLENVEFGFGGPETYTYTEITQLASRALGKKLRIVEVPFWTIDAMVAVTRPFNRNAAGFLKFFQTVASRSLVGTPTGTRSLAEFFHALVRGV